MRTRIVKWGNSLGLRIPKSFAEDARIADGSTVELSLDNGRLVIQAVPAARYTLDELVAGITETNRHGEADMGEAVGGEEW